MTRELYEACKELKKTQMEYVYKLEESIPDDRRVYFIEEIGFKDDNYGSVVCCADLKRSSIDYNVYRNGDEILKEISITIPGNIIGYTEKKPTGIQSLKNTIGMKFEDIEEKYNLTLDAPKTRYVGYNFSDEKYFSKWIKEEKIDDLEKSLIQLLKDNSDSTLFELFKNNPEIKNAGTDGLVEKFLKEDKILMSGKIFSKKEMEVGQTYDATNVIMQIDNRHDMDTLEEIFGENIKYYGYKKMHNIKTFKKFVNYYLNRRTALREELEKQKRDKFLIEYGIKGVENVI